MQEQDLHEKLAALHAALRDADRIDPEARELLGQVMEDIRDALERSEEPRREGLVERLREAVDDFEETHPALTEAAGRVIDALAKMGI